MEKSFEIVIAKTPKGKPDSYNQERHLQGKELEGIVFKKVFRLRGLSRGLMKDQMKKDSKRILNEYKAKYPDCRFTSAVYEVSSILKIYVNDSSL